MKILIATKKTQGRRDNDFDWANEGELVTFGSECDGEHIDGVCGCRRALSGVDSRKATTTFMVVDVPPMTLSNLASRLANSLVVGGWYKTVAEAAVTAAGAAADIANVTDKFAPGTILERRGDTFVVRASTVRKTKKTGRA